jgi:hypothetical protein
MTLREKLDRLEGANIRIRVDLDLAREYGHRILEVLGELVEAQRALERESEAVCLALHDCANGCVFAWDESPAPTVCPSCRFEAAQIAAAELLAQAEVDERELARLRAVCPLAAAAPETPTAEQCREVYAGFMDPQHRERCAVAGPHERFAAMRGGKPVWCVTHRSQRASWWTIEPRAEVQREGTP